MNQSDLYHTITGNDPAARDTALQTLGGWLRRLALRRLGSQPTLAQDCAQEALVAVWRQRMQVRYPAAFLGFCAKVLNGVIVDALRREGGTHASADPADLVGRRWKRVPAGLRVPLDDLPGGQDGTPGEERLPDTETPAVEQQVVTRLLSADVIHRVMAAMARNDLSDDSRAVIAGGFLLEKNDGELAAELGTTRNNVQVIRHRDLRTLRQDAALLADLGAWLG